MCLYLGEVSDGVIHIHHNIRKMFQCVFFLI